MPAIQQSLSIIQTQTVVTQAQLPMELPVDLAQPNRCGYPIFMFVSHHNFIK